MQRIEKTVIIDASRSTVWDALTNPDAIQQWMGEPEMRIEVLTDWKVGGPIVVKGFHHVAFENKGTILRFEPEKALAYTHLSSVSRLRDEQKNHSVIELELSAVATGTSLALTVVGFPTETIFKHLDFYWHTTMEVLKEFIEKRWAGR